MYTHTYNILITGGDDMYYIMDNLRAFLISDPVQTLISAQNGLPFLRLYKYIHLLYFTFMCTHMLD